MKEAKISKSGLLMRRVAICMSAIPVLTLALATKAYAASGIVLTADAVTGANAGILEAVGSIEGTINNQFFFTIAIMFIGIAVVVGFVSTMVRGHRRI